VEQQPLSQFILDRLHSVVAEIRMLFADSHDIGRLCQFPLIISIGATLILDLYLTHPQIWEIIFFNFGISLAVSTISTIILGSILSSTSNGAIDVFDRSEQIEAIQSFQLNVGCVSLIICGTLSLLASGITSILSRS
jgi:hypothetical protein